MNFAEVVTSEVQRNRSLKVLKFLAESVGQPRETSAVHPQSVILLLDMGGCDAAHIGHAIDDSSFRFHDFRRAIPTRIVVDFASDVVKARTQGRTMAMELAFEGAALTTITTVVSDLAHHITNYVRRCEICLGRIDEQNMHGVKFTLRTPGSFGGGKPKTIQDNASTGQWSESDLIRFKSFMDEVRIRSETGGIIAVSMKKWFS